MPTISHSRCLIALAATGAAGALTASMAAAVPAGVASPAGTPRHGNAFRQVKLVADIPGTAKITDKNLVNAWGLAFSPTSPLWVSNNATSTSTLYTGAAGGNPVSKVPLVVSIPGGGAPTGVIYNPTKAFTLSTQGKSGPAAFIFAGEDGDISGWNPTGDATKAVLTAHRAHSVFKGLTMTTMRHRRFLLVTNFHQNRIDIFNRHFRHVTRPGAFRSRMIPPGYAPFNVARLRGRVYVTYAKQDSTRTDDVAGRGHGFVNVFSSRGRFLHPLVRRGVLDSPWGLAIAPRGFGRFAGKLLIGNFGNGRIHVVIPRTGRVVATLRDRMGRPLVIDGLWGLLPGNGTAGRRSDVWFSAGPDGESHGLLGILRARRDNSG
jgi:uncharacterized protein (TIGR03118 family)